MSNLNDAYYGPSIPPPSRTYPHHRRRGSCCCNPFTCCCNCICDCMCCILQIICIILVIVAIFVLLFWFIFRPNMVKFYATNASLTQFDFNISNNTLDYNLALNLTIRNPNKRVGIYYDDFEVRGLYEYKVFASTNIEPFYQGIKSTTSLDNVVLKGQNVVVLGYDGVSGYNKDRNEERFDVGVRLYLGLRFKVGFVKSWTLKPRFRCDLNVPLATVSGNQTSSSSYSTFEPRECGLDWHLGVV